MAPGWTSYKNLQYQAYDITPLLTPGWGMFAYHNNGWYKGN